MNRDCYESEHQSEHSLGYGRLSPRRKPKYQPSDAGRKCTDESRTGDSGFFEKLRVVIVRLGRQNRRNALVVHRENDLMRASASSNERCVAPRAKGCCCQLLAAFEGLAMM